MFALLALNLWNLSKKFVRTVLNPDPKTRHKCLAISRILLIAVTTTNKQLGKYLLKIPKLNQF